MASEWWQQLRTPFDAKEIGKLPKINCPACAQKKDGPKSQRHCDRHVVNECATCGNYLTTGHIHLDYVGHAATTDRLLHVDPEWTWRPMATEVDTGFPKFDAQGGLWILLTIHGVTRPGYGDGKNPKEIIGDAIRNAAMRFGVALDLWAKEDLQADAPTKDAGEGGADPAPTPPADAFWQKPKDADETKIDQAQRRHMFGAAKGRGLNTEDIRAILVAGTGAATTAIPQWQFDRLMLEINKHAKVAT